MGFMGVALTHALASRNNKSPFFFSRFIFDRMKAKGNTHYCFHCGGEAGFLPVKVGRLIKRCDVSRATNQLNDRGYDAMAKHDASHEDGVIGNANKYRWVSDWLEKEIGKKKDFPFVVNVPSV
jgi:hypothetical protein